LRWGLDEIQDKLQPRWTRADGFPRGQRCLGLGNLIKIKASTSAPSIMAPEKQREPPMPTDTIVVLIMATAFGIFAATLYWADLRTRGVSK
jgi:hypothetical protein